LTNIYFIRHGASIEAIVEGKYCGLGLSSEGIKQTELLRDRLAGTEEIRADVLITSPLQRARESAAILAPVLGQPIVQDEGFGEWRCEDGSLTPEEFHARWQAISEAQKPFFRWVAGYETWLEFVVRIQQALNRVIQEHEGKTVVVICHGEVIQASFVYFFGLSGTVIPGVSLENTSITHWFKRENSSRWILKTYNDCQHL
jgi:probable phosphoglycerate mutase